MGSSAARGLQKETDSLAKELNDTRKRLNETQGRLQEAYGVCMSPPVQGFGEYRFRRCVLPWTWDELYYGYGNVRISYQQGALGNRAQLGKFETWVCVEGDPCASLSDRYFCYVFDEQAKIFVPWGPNSELKLVCL